MKIFTVLLIICFLTIVVFAQGSSTLIGKVMRDGVPVNGAEVTLTLRIDSKIRFATQTDVHGRYRFENLPRGTYILRAQSGLFMQAAEELVLAGGEESAPDLMLSPVGPSINESVTISADMSQPIDEVSKTVNVITGQEMRDRADFSLVESLRTIPGFRVQQLGGFGRTATIKTRGLRNQDTAVLIDGVRLRDASAITGDASPFLGDITLTSVSRVEVLRGSGSSLYGTNAVGGTVDFITPEPQPGLHGQVSGAWGGLGLQRYRGNISDGTDDGKFGFSLAVARTLYTEGIDGEDDAHNTNAQGKINFRPWESTTISGRFFVSDAYARLNVGPDTFGIPPVSNLGVTDAVPGVNFAPDVNDPDAFQKTKFFNGQFVLNHIFTPELYLQAYYSGLKTSRKNEDGILGPGFQSPSTTFFDGTIQTAHAHVTWTPNSANTITAGYEFEHEKFGNDGRTPDGFGDFFTRAYQSSNTFYVQDLISLLNDRLQFAGGIRMQRFSLGDPKFSTLNAPYSGVVPDDPPTAYTFDGSASYFFQKTGTKLRAHLGNGYRVPSLYERFGTFYSTFGPVAEFVALGDPGLKPEKTIAFDAGVDQSIFGAKARLTAVYFYTKLIDTIGFGNIVPDIGETERPFGGYENQKGGIARGAEFSGTFKPWNSTYIFASYTYTNSDQRVPQVFGSGVIETMGIPKNQFTLVATQRFERFWVNFDLLATSSYLAPIFSNFSFNTYVFRFEGNRRADLTAGYTFNLNRDKLNVRLFGTVENLFDYEYFENGFRTTGRNGRVGLSFGF